MATHYTILVWGIPMDRGTWQATERGGGGGGHKRVGHDWVTEHHHQHQRPH